LLFALFSLSVCFILAFRMLQPMFGRIRAVPGLPVHPLQALAIGLQKRTAMYLVGSALRGTMPLVRMYFSVFFDLRVVARFNAMTLSGRVIPAKTLMPFTIPQMVLVKFRLSQTAKSAAQSINTRDYLRLKIAPVSV